VVYDGLEMMTVRVPLFCLRHGTAAGLESSLANLIAGMVQAGTSVSLPVSSIARLNPEFADWVKRQPNAVFKQYPRIPGGTWTRFVEETLYYNLETSPDPIIFPNYFLPPAVRRRSTPVYAYIHDCQHRVFPQYFSKRKRRWLDLNFQRTLNIAARVFLISEFERAQIARFFGEQAAANCIVVYNPIDWEKYTRGSASPGIVSISERRFILSVSHQYVHKNSEKIVDAYALLARSNPDLHLVLVGQASKNVADRIGAIGDAGVRNRILLTGFIRDSDLGHLYSKCQMFVLASEYEGFGMSAVEAMGFGVPVMVTDTSSLPEVTLRKATYMATNANAAEWADAIGQQLRASRDMEHLTAAAAAVRAKYQPLAIANSVLKCLRGAA